MAKLNARTTVLRRMSSIVLLLLVLGVTVSAYTVVMQGGRRIEIPARFLVTAATLTYETAPGIQVTLQLAAIDIAATEGANGEAPGSLLRRAQTQSRDSFTAPEDLSQPPQAARRTITNNDLQASVRRRLESETAYERRRKELGLPPVAESRRETLAEPGSDEWEFEQRRVAAQESEDYWRTRAADLRTELAALDAELSFVRRQLEENPFGPASGWGVGSFTNIVPFISLGNAGGRLGGGFGSGSFGGRRSGLFVAPGGGAHFGGRRVWANRPAAGQAIGRQTFGNPGAFPHGRPVGRFSGQPGFSGGVGFASFPGYDYSYERSELITRYNQLGAARAGLNARWRELEDEARRAGASPGWLRE